VFPSVVGVVRWGGVMPMLLLLLLLSIVYCVCCYLSSVFIYIVLTLSIMFIVLHVTYVISIVSSVISSIDLFILSPFVSILKFNILGLDCQPISSHLLFKTYSTLFHIVGTFSSFSS